MMADKAVNGAVLQALDLAYDVSSRKHGSVTVYMKHNHYTLNTTEFNKHSGTVL